MTDETPPRPGSTQDLLRRMDRSEARQDNIEAEVRTLSATVARVEQNQNHATELNKLRFDALDLGIKALGSQLNEFTKRVESILTGEVLTQAGRRGQEIVADYQLWHKEVDQKLDDQAVLNGQVKLLGRIGVLLVSTNVVSFIAAAVAIFQHP